MPRREARTAHADAVTEAIGFTAVLDRPQTPFKVRATQLGYYEHIRRREGDVFMVSGEQAFSSNWMERVNPAMKEKITTGLEDLRRKHDEILGAASPATLTDPLAE